MRIEQELHCLASKRAVFPVIGGTIVRGKVGDNRKRVSIRLAAHVTIDKLFGLLHSLSLVAGILQRPRNVGRDAQHVVVVTVCRAFVDE